jgi:hypothetical protein
VHRIRKALGSSRTIGLIAVSVLLGAACGSTLSHDAFRAAGQTGGGQGLSIGGGGSALGGPTTGGSTTPAGSAGGSLGGTTPGAGPGSIGGTIPAAAAPGVTANTIYIGAQYQENSRAANAAVGAGAIAIADTRPYYNIVIEDINAHGGLAGRKVVPIYYGYDATSTRSTDEQDQAACAKWTQDNRVFAILLGGPIIDECAKRAGVINLGYNGAIPETYQQYPTRIDIDSFNMVRVGSVTVDQLADNGYFTKGARIGLVTWDDPNYRQAIDRGYVAALKRHGLSTAIPTAYLSVPQAPQELSQTSADVSAAVLKFNTRGITHVMILDGPAGACGGTCITLEWVKQADSQRYYPRYGFNDQNSAKEVYDLGLFTPREMRGSISVGWIDLDASYDKGWQSNPAREACYDLMRKHGADVSDVNSQGPALGACTELWFIRAAISRLRGPLSVRGFIDGVNRLGYSYLSAASYANFFSASRHDGAAGVRIARFVDSCECFSFNDGMVRV